MHGLDQKAPWTLLAFSEPEVIFQQQRCDNKLDLSISKPGTNKISTLSEGLPNASMKFLDNIPATWASMSPSTKMQHGFGR